MADGGSKFMPWVERIAAPERRELWDEIETGLEEILEIVPLDDRDGQALACFLASFLDARRSR